VPLATRGHAPVRLEIVDALPGRRINQRGVPGEQQFPEPVENFCPSDGPDRTTPARAAPDPDVADGHVESAVLTDEWREPAELGERDITSPQIDT
jgi:hypothetical protein